MNTNETGIFRVTILNAEDKVHAFWNSNPGTYEDAECEGWDYIELNDLESCDMSVDVAELDEDNYNPDETIISSTNAAPRFNPNIRADR